MTFRLKCLLSAPLYLLFSLYNKNGVLSAELSSWELNTPSVAYKSEFFRFIRMFAGHKEYRSLFFYRLGPIGMIAKIFVPTEKSLHLVTESGKIGRGLVIQHGYSTIIWPEKMCDNCQVWHNVTIGRARPKQGRPTIGNNVKICTGAIVLGEITIGDNVTIAAGAVVVKNVPADCVVCGNPARIVRQRGVKVDIKL